MQTVRAVTCWDMHCGSVPWRCNYICQNAAFPVTPLRVHFPSVDEKAPVSFNEYLKQNTSFIFPSQVTLPLTQQGPVSTANAFFFFFPGPESHC